MFAAGPPFATWNNFNRFMSKAAPDLDFTVTVGYISRNMGPGTARCRFFCARKDRCRLVRGGFNGSQ